MADGQIAKIKNIVYLQGSENFDYILGPSDQFTIRKI